MKKLFTVIAMTIGLLGLSPMQYADAVNHCVTKAEFRKVKGGTHSPSAKAGRAHRPKALRFGRISRS